ncbi:MAG: SAM-dependent chlorinase/fluorinase, partial [Myxococcota bacterium]
MKPLIALSTDFGSDSTYVAQMKGVLLSALPECRIVDVGHSLAVHDVRAAEVHLRSVAFAFPLGVVHLVVVDPGVGSERAAIAVDVRGTRFVGPDNGVLGRYATMQGAQVVRLDREHLWRRPTAPTFHGRDLFAPVAAELAAGAALHSVGSQFDSARPSMLPLPILNGSDAQGEILGVDRFGNLTTNIPVAFGHRYRVRVDGNSVTWVNTYSDVDVGELVSLRGSDGYL